MLTQQQMQPGASQGQKRKRKGFSRRQRIVAIIIVAIIVALAFVAIQVLNGAKIIPDNWATASNAIVGVLGALFTFFSLFPLLFPAKPVSQAPHVPFMVENLPGDFVERPREFEDLIAKLLDKQRQKPIAITAALRGAGGYGKTTIAKALCHDKRIQEVFRDGILWITLGENLTLDKLVGKLEDLIYTLSHERPGFIGLDAATSQFVELLDDHDMLLVIDDVWNAARLKPFQQGGERCARLVTTRDDSVLPGDVQRVEVDAMQQHEAVQLLSMGLNGVAHSARDSETFRALAARLGEWPLLLKLANGVLRERVNRYQQPLHDTLAYINTALDRVGLTFFDAKKPQDRSQAVTQTLSVSFELLSENEYASYRELAIFPEDVDIPLITLQRLWGTTGGLDGFDTEALCERLHRLSLLLHFDLTARTIRLHDVIRSYLQKAVGDALPAIHAHLLDAYTLNRWADLPDNEPYLWDHLAYHLVEASRLAELVATVKDLRYLALKTRARTVYAAETDLAFAEQWVPSHVPLRLLTRNFANMSHLLNRCTTFNEIAAVLYSRLVHLQELSDLCLAFKQDIPRPYLASWHPLPDLPDPALIRTLSGHTDEVRGCAISPAGDFIVSAAYDETLKVWDARTGEERLTLRGHMDKMVYGCAISPAGDFIVSASWDQTLKVWDAHTGEERITLRGHTDAVRGCAISPAGDFIVSASHDTTLKVWDARTGEERLTLRGHTGQVHGCAISPAGDFIASASKDQTLKAWDARTGEERLTLRGHTSSVEGCAISPAGDFIVSASYDQTLKVWDANTGVCLSTLYVNSPLHGCAFHPDGEHIIAVGDGGVYFLRWVR